MTFIKGQSGNPSGKPKGTVNKYTTLKQSILDAYHRLGGVRWLVAQAKENPTAFIALLGRLLPRQVESDEDAITPQWAAWFVREVDQIIGEEITNAELRAAVKAKAAILAACQGHPLTEVEG